MALELSFDLLAQKSKVKVYYETVTKFEGSETYDEARQRGEEYTNNLIEQHQQVTSA